MNHYNFSKLLFILFLFFALFVFGASFSKAAVLSLDSAKVGVAHQDEILTVNVRLDPEEECVNAVEILIVYPIVFFEFIDFDLGDSIISLWIQPPKIDKATGHITFRGGIPNGYCGQTHGVAVNRNLIGRIIFKVNSQIISASSASVSFGESVALLNDGFGTAARLTTKDASFSVSNEKVILPLDPWKQKLSYDNIPPEDFQIEIARDPAIFDNQYFIVFSTVDKHTGIDYYEVKEGARPWTKADSPYVLKNQALSSEIRVKAVDKAGNEIIKTIGPQGKATPSAWPAILLLAAIAALALIFISRRKRKSKLE